MSSIYEEALELVLEMGSGPSSTIAERANDIRRRYASISPSPAPDADPRGGEREAFEAWYRREFPACFHFSAPSPFRLAAGEYIDPTISPMWLAWQAARASSPTYAAGWRERAWCVHAAVTGERCGTETDQRFIALALAGEVGELCNLIKKRWRKEWSAFPENDIPLKDIADEIADINVYLYLLARVFEIDIDAATEAKFTEVEKRYGPDVQAAICALALPAAAMDGDEVP